MKKIQPIEWTIEWSGLAHCAVRFALTQGDVPAGHPIEKDYYALAANWPGGGSNPIGCITHRYGQYEVQAQAYGGDWPAVGTYPTLAAAVVACKDYRAWPHLVKNLGAYHAT